MKRFNKEQVAQLINTVVTENIAQTDQKIYDTCRSAVYDNFKPTKSLLTFMNYDAPKLVHTLITIKRK